LLPHSIWLNNASPIPGNTRLNKRRDVYHGTEKKRRPGMQGYIAMKKKTHQIQNRTFPLSYAAADW
tara:strand:+ start:119 stop:316 length:198 start_codon:yes stop_codon:yes gene_type:complete